MIQRQVEYMFGLYQHKDSKQGAVLSKLLSKCNIFKVISHSNITVRVEKSITCHTTFELISTEWPINLCRTIR